MKGSYWWQGDRVIVGVWYQGKQHKITRYKGLILDSERMALKCLSSIQGRFEQFEQGLCTFRIEEFTGKGWTDVLEYYESWMKEVIEPKRKPATIKGYWSYYHNWIKPFFESNPIRLHEIQLDTLNKLLNSITLTGKGKLNVVMAFRSMMDFAWRSNRIPSVPPFPKREDYNIIEPTIKWLSEERQMSIINAIPETHRPIFLWLKYHLRRPSEACALRKIDYDPFNRIFTIRRSVSARKVVNSTKTGVEHILPCHSSFEVVAAGLFASNKESRFFFVNPRGRRHEGRRYTNESLNCIWRKACADCGEQIDLYSGIKHSSCSQYVNEKGLSIYDLRELTDHKRLDSVRKYAAISVSRKRELMETTKKLPKLKIVGGKDVE